MRAIRILIFFFSVLFFVTGAFAQSEQKDRPYFDKYQDTLRVMAKKLYSLKNDSLKLVYNRQFADKWEEVLLNQLSYDYDFDSLRKDIGVLRAPDDKFRIVNWDVLFKDGSHKYFGFIQVKNTKTGKFELFELNDISKTIKSPETFSGDHTKWMGMLYYKIVKCENYYILLGLDEFDKLVTRKVIEVLSFKPDGSPLFGKNVFNNIPKKFPKRVVFEYSAQSTISVRYDEDDKSIVFNHVSPPDPFLEGQYQFYIPDGSFDCLTYKRGAWTYKQDCDARNPKSRLDNAKPPKEKEKPVFTPN